MIADKAFDLSTDSRKVYISDIPIKGKSFVRVFIDSVGEGGWSIIDESLYQIIDDSVVFSVAPTGVYLVIQVATTPTELTSTPNDATLILALKDDIKAVTANIIPIVSVSDNLDIIIASEGFALTASNKADEASASAIVASNKADEASASAIVASNKADEASASALTATSKANEAEVYALASEGFRNEAESFSELLDPTKIVSKDSPTGSAIIPTGTTLERPISPMNGYIRYNTDLVAFEGYSNGSWSSLGGGATGGGTDHIFNLNDQIINTDYTIPVGKNAMTAGDVTIASGITVTISSGSKWSIV